MDPTKMLEEMATLKSQIGQIIQDGGEGWEVKKDTKMGELKALLARYHTAMELESFQVPQASEARPLKSLIPNPEASGGVATEKALSAPTVVKTLGDDVQKYPFFYAANAAISFKQSGSDKAFRDLFEASGEDFDNKALSTQNGPLGQWMLPTTVSAAIIDMLRNQLVFDKLQVQRWTLPNRQMFFPKQLSDANGYWLAENTAITPSDFIGGAIELSLKDLGTGIIVPNNLLNTTVRESVNKRIQDTLVAQMRRAMELSFLMGDGGVPAGTGNTGGQPRGLLNITGTKVFNIGAEIDGTTGKKADGGIPTINDFSRAMNMIENSNITLDDSFAWIARSGMREVFRTISDSTGRPIFLQSVAKDNSPDMLYGHPVYYTNALPNNITTGASTNTSYIFGGVWRHFLIGDGGNIAVDASNQAGDAFWKNQTFFRAIASCDCNVEYPEAFVVMKGVKFS